MTIDKSVPKGYKRTEVGVIPEDWLVKSLGELFVFSGGYTASREQLSDCGICYLHYGDIHKSNKSYIDVSMEHANIPKLDIPIDKVPKKSLLGDGDVVFVDASEDNEGTSRHIVVRNPQNISYISGLHTIVSKNRGVLLDNKYKQYCFQTRNVKKQFVFYAVGTKVSGISKTNIKKIEIPVPPSKTEQSAIATMLSDTDDLIERMEKLISKKRAIKQGAMQELLTGRRRLPGFSREWEIKKLGELGKPYGGLSGKVKNDFGKGDDYYIPFMNIMSNPIIDPNYLDAVRIHAGERQNKAQKGDLFFNGSSETPEEVGMASVLLDDISNLYLNSFCFGFRFNQELKTNGLFLSYFFRSNAGRKLIFFLAQGATRYNLSKNNFVKLEIPCPKPEEQAAIAEVISDMDTEIESLKQKLAKYNMIKQGMMQVLLTGKIRIYGKHN